MDEFDQFSNMDFAQMAPMLAFVGVIALIVAIIGIITMWKIFTKAGRPGWYCLIPIWNTITLIDIAGKPTWWLILFFIPLANIFAIIMIYVGLAKSFGYDELFALGLLFFSVIFFLILAFGDSRYIGPGGEPERKVKHSY